ncbi:MAG: lipid-A-disaccharide synthase [Geminicoccus sp.]|nr:lipid-A-disaccharide synthase [Geminicoccus sp.]
MKIAVLTGEPSGDLLAHSVIEAVQAQVSDLELIGIGGERLAERGLRSRFPLSEFSLNGIAEVLPHLPRLLLRIEQITRWLLSEQPDVVLSVDAPDLTLRIAKALRHRGYRGKLVHLVAPTVWAWKPERAASIAEFLDHVLCLFPFEPPYFEAHGLGATFIGHPIVSRPPPTQPKDPSALLLLPGSRMNEARAMVPLFRAVVERLVPRFSGLRCVVPTVSTTRGFVTANMGAWPTPIEFVFRAEDKQRAFEQAGTALAASGTVALELAQAEVPGVITYRLSALSYARIMRQTSLRHLSLINILANREVMPERMQDRAEPDGLAEAVGVLLNDPAQRATQIEEQKQALARLALPAGQSPAKLAADTLLTLIRAHRHDLRL